jgi:hypothetical protein
MNTSNHREVEKKFTIVGLLLDDVYEIIMNYLPASLIKGYINPCETTDFYWKAPENSEIQFVRLRDSWGIGSDGFSRQLQEITVKAKDNNNNVDRLELNLGIKEPKEAKMILNLLFGPSYSIKKEEIVLFIREVGASSEVVISLAQVNNKAPIYLEIEAKNEEIIDLYVAKLEKKFKFKQEMKSMYEIYIESKL